MDSFWKKLAGFVVDALLARFGIKPEDNLTLDDLIGKLTAAFRAEITEDLDKLDEIPGKVVAGVLPQLTAPVQQMMAQVQQIVQTVGNIPGQIMGSIQNLLNPFK